MQAAEDGRSIPIRQRSYQRSLSLPPQRPASVSSIRATRITTKKDPPGRSCHISTCHDRVVADPNNTFARLGQGTLDIADRIRTK